MYSKCFTFKFVHTLTQTPGELFQFSLQTVFRLECVEKHSGLHEIEAEWFFDDITEFLILAD